MIHLEFSEEQQAFHRNDAVLPRDSNGYRTVFSGSTEEYEDIKPLLEIAKRKRNTRTVSFNEVYEIINGKKKDVKNVQADKDLLEKWVLSYSISQNCFHVEELKHYLLTNLKDAVGKYKEADYKMIGLYEKEMDAHKFSEYLLTQEPFKDR